MIQTDVQQLSQMFVDRLYMTEEKASETCKNSQLSGRLAEVLETIGSSVKIDAKHAKLIIFWCSNVKNQAWKSSQILIDYISQNKIDSVTQIEYALEYLLNNLGSVSISFEDFESHIGIGVVISENEIAACVKNLIQESNDKPIKSKIITQAHKKLKFANRLDIMKEVGSQLESLGVKNGKKNVTKEPNDITYAQLFEDTTKFHKVGENFKTDRYQMTSNTMEHMKNHLERTGGKVMTRFPPEPSGILHIGHVKAINLDFGYAKYKNGHTYMRFDDTNPATEQQHYMDEIINNIHWLGYEPFKVTYSSDYFNELYNFAVKMIEMDHAYVCHMTKEQLKDRSITESPWRNRPLEESLSIFDQMKQGMFEEGKATLRLKYTMEDGKVDPVAYRINYAEHSRTGKKWCIYPSYDFSHPIVDSIEDISHSMCSKEFMSHRSFYYWLCNSLDIYCPVQWEFGRLNLTHTITSKRKFLKAIEHGVVDNWDDPRLFTISALKRRGIPRSALFKFSEANSVTVADSFISPKKLEAFARNELNETSGRAIAILRPIKVNITNFTDDLQTEFDFYDFPQKPNPGKKHRLLLKQSIYIDEKDCDLKTTDKNYLRLKPGQKVGLMNTKYQIELDPKSLNGDSVSHVNVLISAVTDEPPRIYIHWLANPLIAEVRIFKNLFMHEFPEKPEYGGFLNDVNPDSLDVLKNVFIERRLASAKVHDTFQFVREGFFCVDKDSTDCKLVFNLTVGLKDIWTSKSSTSKE